MDIHIIRYQRYIDNPKDGRDLKGAMLALKLN